MADRPKTIPKDRPEVIPKDRSKTILEDMEYLLSLDIKDFYEASELPEYSYLFNGGEEIWKRRTKNDFGAVKVIRDKYSELPMGDWKNTWLTLAVESKITITMDFSVTGRKENLKDKEIEKLKAFLSYSVNQYIDEYLVYQAKYKNGYMIFVESFGVGNSQIVMGVVVRPNFPEFIRNLRIALNQYVNSDQGNVMVGEYKEINITKINLKVHRN